MESDIILIILGALGNEYESFVTEIQGSIQICLLHRFMNYLWIEICVNKISFSSSSLVNIVVKKSGGEHIPSTSKSDF